MGIFDDACGKCESIFGYPKKIKIEPSSQVLERSQNLHIRKSVSAVHSTSPSRVINLEGCVSATHVLTPVFGVLGFWGFGISGFWVFGFWVFGVLGGVQIRTLAYKSALSDNPSLMKNAAVIDLGCGTGILR